MRASSVRWGKGKSGKGEVERERKTTEVKSVTEGRRRKQADDTNGKEGQEVQERKKIGQRREGNEADWRNEE